MESTHAVRSNREYGLGRADLCLTPKSKDYPGIILEFKAARSADLSTVAAQALAQIRSKAYAHDLAQAGISPIYAYGVAIAGKHVAVALADLTPPPSASTHETR